MSFHNSCQNGESLYFQNMALLTTFAFESGGSGKGSISLDLSLATEPFALPFKTSVMSIQSWYAPKWLPMVPPPQGCCVKADTSSRPIPQSVAFCPFPNGGRLDKHPDTHCPLQLQKHQASIQSSLMGVQPVQLHGTPCLEVSCAWLYALLLPFCHWIFFNKIFSFPFHFCTVFCKLCSHSCSDLLFIV